MKKFRMMATVAVFALLLGFSHSALAQATLQEILHNGPKEKRINIVFLSEGYTSPQLSQYIIDASNNLNAMMGTSPYNAYHAYFNAFAISVASVESGSDHPSSNIYHNTFFNSTFDSFGITRLITIDNEGENRVDSLLQLLIPEYDIVIMIVNDPQYGGSGGSIAIASTNSASSEITIHELGHSFAKLGDEYADPYPGYPDIEEPNTTQDTVRTTIKWRDWILNSTPLPTPQTSGYSTVVGLFEGAHYHATGWYRPKLDCKMRTLGVPFCEICSEALVKSMYEYVRPIESYSPIDSALILSDSQSVSLSLVPMIPSSNSLSVHWFVDGIQQNGATSSSFTVSGSGLESGPHLVHTIVRDTTSLVRSDSSELLRDSLGWSVTVSKTSTVENGIQDNIPRRFSLAQNYPNPFNPSTMISFSVPTRSFVSLKIFDLIGREVSTIVSGELQAGTYTQHWNATNVASGVYFYRMQAGTYTETKKLLLLK